ncbi:MAG: hypothetical protein ACK4NN_11605 [Rheinheimera sp.]
MLGKFLSAILLLSSIGVEAGIIEYNGYSRDESSNIVRGGGLEWLKWDATAGLSIQDAIVKYEAQGWKLANNSQMTSLVNSFKFGKDSWINPENDGLWQTIYQPWTSEENSAHNHFSRIFGGFSLSRTCNEDLRVNCTDSKDPHIFSAALFGEINNIENEYNHLMVIDDYTFFYGNSSTTYNQHYAEMVNDNWPIEWSYYMFSVALVRAELPSNPIPAPGSVGIVILSVIWLAFRNRSRKIVLFHV